MRSSGQQLYKLPFGNLLEFLWWWHWGSEIYHRDLREESIDNLGNIDGLEIDHGFREQVDDAVDEVHQQIFIRYVDLLLQFYL